MTECARDGSHNYYPLSPVATEHSSIQSTPNFHGHSRFTSHVFRICRILNHLPVLTTRLAARRVLTTKVVAPQSSAVSLLPDLVLHILAYLPPETIVALALTCHRLCRYMPSPHPLSKKARLTLLNWLTRDNPPLYLCFRYNELHTWLRVRPDYRNLTVTTGFSWSLERNIKLRQSLTAHIIGDEPYLKAHVKLYHKKGRAYPLRLYSDDADDETRKLVCHHVSVPGRLPFGLGQCPVRELDREQGFPDMLVPVAGRLQSYRYCFTDFRINVQWLPL